MEELWGVGRKPNRPMIKGQSKANTAKLWGWRRGGIHPSRTQPVCSSCVRPESAFWAALLRAMWARRDGWDLEEFVCRKRNWVRLREDPQIRFWGP